MKAITLFDPTVGAGNLDTQGINTGEQLMLYNDSPYGLLLTFPNNDIDMIPAYWNKDFILEHMAMGVIKWKVFNALSSSTGWPISEVYGTLYERDERVASINASMQRGVSVTNQIGVTTTGTNTLTNTGNPGPATIIDIQSSDSITPEVISDNLGNLQWFGSNGSGVLTQLLRLFAGASPKVQLGALNALVEIMNNLQVDGDITATDVTASATFNSPVYYINGPALPANRAKFSSDGSGNWNCDAPDGTRRFQIVNSNGQVIISQALQVNGNMSSGGNVSGNAYTLNAGSGNYGLYKNSISRISSGTYTSSTGVQTITHDLGATPTLVWTVGNTSTGSSTSGVDSFTSTTFKVIDGFSGVSMRWFAMRY